MTTTYDVPPPDGKYTTSNGDEFWYRNGLFHRDDGPAVILAVGTELWYQDGSLHREDGPAMINSNDTWVWFFQDRIHRLDGPALRSPEGEEVWYINGILVDPLVVFCNGGSLND